MTELATDFESDGSAYRALRSREPRLGFVSQEPLDTMLKLERSPPPLFDMRSGGAHADPGAAVHYGATSNLQRLQAVQMTVKLAELIMTLEDEIMQSGDQAAIDGFGEVHRFLLHSQHLRALQEG